MDPFARMLVSAHPDYPDLHKDLRYLGYWRSMDRRRTRDPYPAAEDYIDHTWDVEERALVIEHLRSGYRRTGGTLYLWIGSSTCRFCGLRPNGKLCLTDGTYAWPEGLIHQVEVHGMRLPQEFVDHVKNPPSVQDQPLKLHW